MRVSRSDRLLFVALVIVAGAFVFSVNAASSASREATRGREEALTARRLRSIACRLQVSDAAPWTHGSTWALVVAPVDGGDPFGVVMWHDEELGEWRIDDAPWIDATR